MEEETEHTSEEEREEEELPLIPSASPPQNPLQEDELAHILANMSEYIQPQSPLNLNTKVEKSQEHSAHGKNTS